MSDKIRKRLGDFLDRLGLTAIRRSEHFAETMYSWAKAIRKDKLITSNVRLVERPFRPVLIETYAEFEELMLKQWFCGDR